MKYRTILPLLLFLPVCAMPFALSAKDTKAQKKMAQQEAQRQALAALQRGEILPLARILEIANQHVPGDVVEVEFKGGPVYEVKILLAGGQLREVKLDARNGALLKLEVEAE